jgi:hypothetical protein
MLGTPLVVEWNSHVWLEEKILVRIWIMLKSNRNYSWGVGILYLIAGVCLSCFFGNTSYAGEWPIPIEIQHKPGTYWWSPGSAWDPESIDWNLQNLKEGGIGTVHIIPIYGAKGYEDRTIPFLSDRWNESLQTILKKAESLGLQVDMTTGTGWCFGGPDLEPAHYDMRMGVDRRTGELQINNNRMVKRAAPGGQGHMMNPFSTAAMEAYLRPFDEAFQSAERLPRSQYHDSFEYFGNWSLEFPDEFKKRRGYDIQAHMDTIFRKEDDEDKASRIKYDYRLTAAELHEEFIQVWADWARSKGMLTRNEAHGSPSNLLDVYAAADIAETEMFGSPEFPIPGFRREAMFCREGDSDPRICKMASSAAHVAHEPGRQLVASESCTWLREHWHGTLGQIKLAMDLFFLAGVNHVFYHGSCYSPKDVPWPGFFFYASTKADWRNSIWRDMPILNDYITRCQSVLQAGQPANDVLVYWPIHDLWMNPEGQLINLTVHGKQWMADQPIGDMATRLDQQGYAFDFISDKMLDTLTCSNKVLHAPGGDYKAIVIPACRYLPVATATQLANLSRQGATVIFENALPGDVPGYADLQKRRAAFAQAKAQLEKAIVAPDALAALAQTTVKRETMSDHGLRYIRRKTEGAYWYFIANHSADPVTGWLDLCVPFESATLHDPMTGKSALLPVKHAASSQQVYMDIQPGEAMIVQAHKTKQQGEFYIPMQAAGDFLPLAGTWNIVFFDGGPELPTPYQADTLSCWTHAPDKKAQAFAGTARYTLSFDFAKSPDADDYILSLGDVRDSARVTINGQKAASLVALPMQSRVGAFLKNGKNTIEIEVTNLAANRIRDLDMRGVNWKIMDDINIVNQNYEKFDATKWPLQPSGLLGPVTLTPLKKVDGINS